MKKTIASLCFLAVGLAGPMKISIGSRIAANNLNIYDLNCDGGYGNVKYYVDGLPNGVSFDGSSISVTSNANVGSYTIRIKAVDEAENSAERVITLSITNQYSAGQLRGGAQNGNGANRESNSGVNGGNNAVLPGGSTPGSNPGSSVPSGGNNAPRTPRLDGILSTFSAPQNPLPNYGDRFPEPKFPTAVDPNIPNTSLITIPTDQARPTAANRNPITPDDVALRAASDRHQNAIKGITNLIKIIDQARANKDKAQNDIQAYTQAYNDAVAGQRNAQNDIISFETKTSQIVSAITNLTATVDDLRNRIN